jgi:formamidopyrimidine-DNA glycosylase
MPELPEVETIRRALCDGGPKNPSILGRVITTGRLLWARSLAAPTPDEFERHIAGQVILDIDRRGKFFVFRLDRDALIIHLRMSGDLWVESGQAPIAPHHRLMLDFEDGTRLAFNDPRKFGRVWLTADPLDVLGNLGPEPFDPDLTAARLYAMLAAKHRQLKPLLLDQTFIAGLGNIYTDESLHRAGLHPLLSSERVTPDQSARLLDGVRESLAEGIRRNGASIDWVYRGGDFQNYFRVYGRTGQPCPVCATPIEHIAVGQRSTHFCSRCQPLLKEAGA